MSRISIKLLQKMAAVAILFLLLAAAVLGLGGPALSKFSELRSEIDEQRLLLGRLAESAVLEARSDDLANRIQLASGENMLFTAPSSALNAARLQSILADLASRQRTRLKSARALPPKKEGNLQMIAIEASFECGLAELQQILISIRTSKPSLAVLGLHVMTVGPNSEAKGNILDVRLEVGGIEKGGT